MVQHGRLFLKSMLILKIVIFFLSEMTHSKGLPASGVSTVDLGVDLSTQLALVSLANGFLGMASGLCTAANLSETPHVILTPRSPYRSYGERVDSADRYPFESALFIAM